ncbi:glycosyltransferase [Segatella paludivivens]|uniref:glycosyltransferase n=1 Tax=Segatella paludivivens TaxID=185294 RepID=UPI000375F62B|nr:glycosyltransferase [Segatella paludivivens]
MRIILANKFYYHRGGDCIYTINLEKLLKQHGHDVAVFAMNFPNNINTEWNKYFPSEVNFKFGLGMIEAFMRPFGTSEVMRKFAMLLNDFNPDVVHLNNIHSQLSPAIAEIAHKKGIKVIWTLHDYKLLCPRYDCLQNGIKVCEKCFDDKHNVLRYKCMKNSVIASYLSYFEATKWNRKKIESITDIYVCPSKFMASKMNQGKFSKKKLFVLNNFIDIKKCYRENYSRKNYYCYIGRLSEEKGVETLINAANSLPYKLKVIGDGPLRQELERLSTANKIEFVGKKDWNEIKGLVGNARFIVIPSEWYENNPLSVIEALCLGTPVLGANIGGIPELIDESFNGMLFESRNVENLRCKIDEMWNASFQYAEIAKVSQDRYNAEKYYDEIMKIYKN